MEQGSYDEHGYYVSKAVKVHKVYRELLNMEDKYGREIISAAIARYIVTILVGSEYVIVEERKGGG